MSWNIHQCTAFLGVGQFYLRLNLTPSLTTDGGHASVHVYTSPPSQGKRANADRERMLRRLLGRRVLENVPPAPLTAASSLSELERKNRSAFLDKVEDTWITHFLEQSLEQAVWIELGLQERRDLLPNPWHFTVQEFGQATPSPLPPGTTIEQVYAQARAGQLLIVGEPGSGKTTQLLHLARSLIHQARQDETQPLPAVFTLSSWAQKRLPLDAWLLKELWSRYQVPSQMRQAWVREGRLLPLLDGLDEVSSEHQPACVAAINTYLQTQLEQQQQATPIAICCRSQEYLDMVPRVAVGRAIQLLPLTNAQIDAYFQERGPAVKTLWQAVREDEELHALAREPLMLSVFTLAYQGADQAMVPVGKTREEALPLVWNTYIDRMLHRRRPLLRWTEQEAQVWLRLLAHQMKQQSQTIFEVESLQRDWLPPRARHLFLWCCGVVLGMIGGVIGSVVNGTSFGVIIGAGFGMVSGWKRQN